MIFSAAALPAAHCCLKVGPLGPAGGALAQAHISFGYALYFDMRISTEEHFTSRDISIEIRNIVVQNSALARMGLQVVGQPHCLCDFAKCRIM